MMTASPCPSCGAPNAGTAAQCAGCGQPLPAPDPARRAPAPPFPGLRRGLGATLLAVLIAALGAFAIYQVHRTMPQAPPGFERSGPSPGLSPEPSPGPASPASAASSSAPSSSPAPQPVPPADAVPRTGTPDAAPPAPAAPEPVLRPEAAPAPAPPADAPRSGGIADRLAAVQRAQCGDEALLGRFVCNERVRLRFCRDRWNAHPDCIVGTSPGL